MAAALKKVGNWFFPGVERSEDGRERWPSRTAFVLASMGVAVGIGNLLRYPSIAFRNNGLQWFIPYFLALFFIGIPLLMMEIAIGQAYRGGAVKAFGRVSKRMKGIGLGTTYIAYVVATYYVVILSWAMVFFRNSFIRPLPWRDNPDFFTTDVVRNGPQLLDNSSNPEPFDDPNRIEWARYPETGVVGETVGWAFLLWFLVYVCICKGVSLTGRVVYVTMLVPIAMLIIIMIRSVTLPNAGRGIKLYVGEWNGEQLGSGDIWRDAVGQVFFSIGVGFSSFIAYASYNAKYANAVQDALIISLSNSLYEIVAGFAAFGVIGYLNISPTVRLTTFTVAFETYPQAIAALPGSNAWAAVFFLTVVLLGIDSAFGLLEGFITVVTDTDWGKALPRPLVAGIVTLIAAILSIMYATEFGSFLMDAVDGWVNNLALTFCALVECISMTTLYRYKDVISQTGYLAFVVANVSYVGSMVLGVILAHTVSTAVGAGVFAAILVLGTICAVVISEKPTISGWWGSNKFVNSFWWLTSYSGHQLSLDLNAIIARGKNWGLPILWAPLLRWISAPILTVILSISYEGFYATSKDQLQVFGFFVAHVSVLFVTIGFVIPQSMNIFVSSEERDAYEKQYAKGPREILDVDETISEDQEKVKSVDEDEEAKV